MRGKLDTDFLTDQSSFVSYAEKMKSELYVVFFLPRLNKKRQRKILINIVLKHFVVRNNIVPVV